MNGQRRHAARHWVKDADGVLFAMATIGTAACIAVMAVAGWL
ncbi:hypothetical protein [Streptomyces sp. TRM70350]|nr:hypothetical protein [Streptomyces sp. TRM70350]